MTKQYCLWIEEVLDKFSALEFKKKTHYTTYQLTLTLRQPTILSRKFKNYLQ